MQLKKVDFDKTNQFSKIFLDYINNKSQLQPFYGLAPTVENFQKQISEKSFSSEQRKILCQALTKQYEGFTIDQAVTHNINALKKENTFTVTTGHQLNIFTGPLYLIYKIVAIINTCQQLNEKYPDYHFVPVYWMASEDHDFEEISHFRLNKKKISWITDQTGAVGHFDPADLTSIAKDIPGIPDFFMEAYGKQKTLAGAVRQYINHLFQAYGLLIIDGDDALLKKQFTSIIKDDLVQNTANDLVNKQSEELDKAGYKTQVYPRKINFFYLKNNIRERIVFENEEYEVLNTDLKFSKEELFKELENHPERFSPNVIMRPVYEEVVLPNLAYTGGPGELAYWFQLKSVFEHYNISFPILMPRTFGLIIPEHIQRKMNKAALSIENIFKPKHDLLKMIVINHAEEDVALNGQKDSIMQMFDKIKAMAVSIDPTLSQHVEAQQTITANKLDNIQKKFIRAEKKKQSIRVNQVEDVLNELFPNGSLQERTDNFLNFYMGNPSLISQLIHYFEPFDFRFNVIIDG